MVILFFVLSIATFVLGCIFMFGRNLLWEILSMLREYQGVQITRTEKWDRKQKAAGLAFITASCILAFISIYFVFLSTA